MTVFSLCKYTAHLKNAWDDMVLGANNGTFLHRRDYISYHSDRFQEESVLVYRNSVPVAIFPCNRHDNQIVSHGGLTYGGLVHGASLRVADVLDIFRLLVDHYKAMGCNQLLYKPVPQYLHKYPCDEDLYVLYRLGAQLVRRDLNSVIFLPAPVKFSDLRVRKEKKAEKNRILITIDENVEAFYRMLCINLKKYTKKPVHSLDELQLLKQRFPKNISIFCAKNQDELLAGTVIYDLDHAVHCQYISSSDLGRNVGALDYLFSYLIREYFSDRRYFSFGISTENDGKYLNDGLIFQKEGFGARAMVHDFYQLDFPD